MRNNNNKGTHPGTEEQHVTDVCGQEGHFNLVGPLPLIVADTDIEEVDVSPVHQRQDGRQDRFDGRQERFDGRQERFDGRQDRFEGRQERFDGRQRARRRRPVRTIIDKWIEDQIKKNLFVKKFGRGCLRSLEAAELKVLEFTIGLIQ